MKPLVAVICIVCLVYILCCMLDCMNSADNGVERATTHEGKVHLKYDWIDDDSKDDVLSINYYEDGLYSVIVSDRDGFVIVKFDKTVTDVPANNEIRIKSKSITIQIEHDGIWDEVNL